MKTALQIGMAALLLITSARALADEETPETIPIRIDDQFTISPLTPIDPDNLLSGNTLNIIVDPTESFGTKVQPSKPGEPLFAVIGPESKHFYIDAPTTTGLLLEAGTCNEGTTGWLPLPEDDLSIACTDAPDQSRWKPVEGDVIYDCSSNTPLGDSFRKDKDWRLVRHVDPGKCPASADGGTATAPGIGEAKECGRCYATYSQIKVAAVIEKVEFVVTQGGQSPQSIDAAKVSDDDPERSFKIPLQGGQLTFTIRITRKGQSPTEHTFGPYTVRTRDTHSHVRMQFELLATNRLRTVSPAVAVTPVSACFFKKGPFAHNFSPLCSWGPTFLIRFSGDEKTVVQIGGGLSLYLTRSLQLNAGLLVGTSALTSEWSATKNWFVGFAIDPVLLSDVKTAEGGITQ